MEQYGENPYFGNLLTDKSYRLLRVIVEGKLSVYYKSFLARSVTAGGSLYCFSLTECRRMDKALNNNQIYYHFR